jgi:sensor domain CHASE-containing protein
LHDALLEDKVKSIAQAEIMKSQSDIRQQLDQRTKRIREYVETQVKQSQLSVENLKDDMKFHQSMSMS